MNPPLTVFVLLAAGLGFIAVQAISQDRTAQRIDPPGTNARPENLTFNIDLPPIAKLTHYYGENSDSWAPFNPFIPPDKRLKDVAISREPPRTTPPITTVVIVAPKQQPLPPPPTEPSLAPLDLTTVQLPAVIGGFIHHGNPVLVVLQGETPAVLAVGEAIGEWTLRRVDDNSAWFTQGEKTKLTRVPIGMSSGDTAMEGSSAKTNNSSVAQPTPPPTPPPAVQTNDRRERNNGERQNDNNRSNGRRFSFRDPSVRQVLRENPDFFDIIRDNPTEAQRLINEALERQQREQSAGDK